MNMAIAPAGMWRVVCRNQHDTTDVKTIEDFEDFNEAFSAMKEAVWPSEGIIYDDKGRPIVMFIPKVPPGEKAAGPES